MPAKKIVYDLSGKEPQPLERFAIVANEMVASDPDRFSFSIPEKGADKESEKSAKKK